MNVDQHGQTIYERLTLAFIFAARDLFDGDRCFSLSSARPNLLRNFQERVSMNCLSMYFIVQWTWSILWPKFVVPLVMKNDNKNKSDYINHVKYKSSQLTFDVIRDARCLVTE